MVFKLIIFHMHSNRPTTNGAVAPVARHMCRFHFLIEAAKMNQTIYNIKTKLDDFTQNHQASSNRSDRHPFSLAQLNLGTYLMDLLQVDWVE